MTTLKQKLDETLLQDKDFRQIFFDRLTKLENNWQKHRTPEDITRKMTAKTDLANKMICVIFNMELIEQLIVEDGVPPQNIRFIADNPQEAVFADKVFGVASKYVSESEGIKGIRKAMEEF